MCDLDAPVVGAYYGKLLARAADEGRITGVPYDPAAHVFTAWDLGMDDSTAIWVAQCVGREIHIIDYYEANGQPDVYKRQEQGAPIVVEGRGNNVRYCAEVAALQAWRVVTNRAQRSKSLRPENLVNPPDVQSPYG